MKSASMCRGSKDVTLLSGETKEKTDKHPCYSFSAHHQYARMHLPVAPLCNLSCRYCNRKFDCLHESRPGVTSTVLSPAGALVKYIRVKEKFENLSVAGIAGPGDALANWKNTKRTIAIIKEYDPEVIFCLSTNGLMLPQYAPEIIKLGLRHVTVTVNCLDPVIGARIYKNVQYQGQIYDGPEGIELLIQNQLAGIAYLARYGVLVKVNTVMIKGINDRHIPLVVKKVRELGAFIQQHYAVNSCSGQHL
jgi:nitrogen fixation protein NifB